MSSKLKRFDMRLDVEQKELLERAALASGQSVTDFARLNLLAKAREVLHEMGSTTLSDKDRDIFLKILDSESGPNEALKKALRRARHRRA